MSKSLKNWTLGFLTTVATIVPHGVKAQVVSDDKNVDDKIEFVEKKQALEEVILKRYSKINPKTANFEAERIIMEASAMLAINDSSFTEYMKLANEILEEKEVHAERMKAYTIQKGDDEKLADMKREASTLYKECLDLVKRVNKNYADLKAYKKKNTKVENKQTSADLSDEEGIVSKNILDSDEKELKLEQNYANNLKYLVDKLGELNKLDVPLRLRQLQHDIKNGKITIKQYEEKIELWKEIQAKIDKDTGTLNALQLDEFDEEVKSKISGNQNENNALSSESVETAYNNLKNFNQAKELKRKIDAYKSEQLALGAVNLDSLVAGKNRAEEDLALDKQERKELRKKGNQGVKAFAKDPYGGEFEEAATEFLEACKKNEVVGIEDNEAVSTERYQNKLLTLYQNAEKHDTKTLSNGGKQIDFAMKNESGEYVVTAIEYPDGKSAIFEQDKVLMYNKDGKLNQTYKLEKTSNGARLGANARTVVEGFNSGNYR